MLAGKAVPLLGIRGTASCILHFRGRVGENRVIRIRLAEILGLKDVTPVHLTHELYHHLEAKLERPAYRIQP